MKYLFVSIISILLSAGCLAQNGSLPLNLSLFNESTAIPYTRFFTTPVHPGIQIGTEFNYQTKAHSRLFQTANVYYFYHRYLAQGYGLSTDFGYEYRSNLGVAFSGLIGVGYLHTFTTAEEFTFSNGKYEKRPDKGNARITPSLALEAGYYLKPKETSSSKIFIRYQSWVEYPYSPGFIPLMSHINLHLGFKFFIQKSSQRND